MSLPDQFRQIDHMIASYKQQIENLKTLKRSLATQAQEKTNAPAKTLSFSQSDISALHKAYCSARADNLDSFIFKGNEFVTRYAHYMLEYLTGKAPDCNKR